MPRHGRLGPLLGMFGHQLPVDLVRLVGFAHLPQLRENPAGQIGVGIELVALFEREKRFAHAIGAEADFGLLEKIAPPGLADFVPGRRPGDRCEADGIADRPQKTEGKNHANEAQGDNSPAEPRRRAAPERAHFGRVDRADPAAAGRLLPGCSTKPSPRSPSSTQVRNRWGFGTGSGCGGGAQ